jgi:hypothetical protein
MHVSEELMRAASIILIAVAASHLPTLAFGQTAPLAALKTCLEIEDQSKERLDCYDAKIAPAPRRVSASPKAVSDCRFLAEEDERLNCFNRFVNAPSPKAKKKAKKS